MWSERTLQWGHSGVDLVLENGDEQAEGRKNCKIKYKPPENVEIEKEVRKEIL